MKRNSGKRNVEKQRIFSRYFSRNLSSFKEKRVGLWFHKTRNHHFSYPEEWSEHYFQVEDKSFWFQYRNHVISRILKKYPPSGPIWDIGGGNGVVARCLQEQGWKVFLLDANARAVFRAYERGVRPVFCATLEEACFRKESLEAVGMFDVLEHLSDDRKIVKTFFRCLRPGGRFYLTVPAFPCLWSPEDEAAGHFRRYTKKSLLALLESCGFRIEFFSYFFFFLTPAVFLGRVLPYRWGFFRKVRKPSIRIQHGWPSAFRVFVDSVLRLETPLLVFGKIPFGTSAMVVARKI